MLKRIGLTVLLIGIVGSGANGTRLVADEKDSAPQESPAEAPEVKPNSADDANEALRDQIASFSARLQVGDSETLAQFQKTLGTEAGVIVLNDRAARRAALVREKAQANALTDYLKLHFEVSGDGYALREGQPEYRESFLKSAAQINDAIATVAAVVTETIPKIDAESDEAKMLLRFLENEGAAPMLYFTVQPYLRPGGALIERELGKIFVRDEKGIYQIRPGRRPDAEQFVTQTNLQLSLINPLQREMAAWAKDLALVDDLHKQLQSVFADPLCGVYIASKMSQQDGEAQQLASSQLNKFFDGMEKTVRDTPDGMVILDEARGQIEKFLAEFAPVRQSADAVRPMLTQYASQIQVDDDVNRQWADLLRSDIAVVMFGRTYEAGAVTPEVAIRATFARLFTEENGRLKLISGNEQQAEQFASKMLRDYREARRKGQSFTDFSAKITDAEFGEVFASTGGKFVMTTEAQAAVSELEIAGFVIWRDEFFEATDGGYIAKNGAADEIRDILTDVAKVGEELEKDDF